MAGTLEFPPAGTCSRGPRSNACCRCPSNNGARRPTPRSRFSRRSWEGWSRSGSRSAATASTAPITARGLRDWAQLVRAGPGPRKVPAGIVALRPGASPVRRRPAVTAPVPGRRGMLEKPGAQPAQQIVPHGMVSAGRPPAPARRNSCDSTRSDAAPDTRLAARLTQNPKRTVAGGAWSGGPDVVTIQEQLLVLARHRRPRILALDLAPRRQ
jgi:hypothetical protein